MSRRWRRAAIVVGLVAAGILIWKYAPLQEVRWQGGLDLTVHIESPQSIRKLRVYSVGRRDVAEHMFEIQREIANPKDAANVLNEFKSIAFEPYDGQPFRIMILMYGKSNQSGYDYNYGWFKALIVVGEYADGRLFQVIVDVPNPRVTREIIVQLP